MEATANLNLPYIMPSQAQKHVTYNEAIRRMDALVQLAVLDRDRTEPPAFPADGERYLVPADATEAWTGKDGDIATWQDGAWEFLAPKAGWVLWIGDEERLVVHDGIEWQSVGAGGLNPAAMVGVNAVADLTNRLSVRSPSVLFDEEDGDHRLMINKAETSDTASLIFLTGQFRQGGIRPHRRRRLARQGFRRWRKLDRSPERGYGQRTGEPAGCIASASR